MDSQTHSVVCHLVDRRLLKFRGETLILDQNERTFLELVARNAREHERWKYAVLVPECRNFLLKLTVLEILYLSADTKKFCNIYFITDGIGRVFLINLLEDFSTIFLGLRPLLLPDKSPRVKILIHRKPQRISENDVLVFFRTMDKISDVAEITRGIAIITLRDLHRLRGEEKTIMKAIEKEWNFLRFDENRSVQDRYAGIYMDEVFEEALDQFCSELRASGILSNPIMGRHARSFLYFYSAVPVPLKFYTEYRESVRVHEKYLPRMLPSEYLKRLAHSETFQYLEHLCHEIEKKMTESNVKYSEILRVMETSIERERRIAVVLPKKTMVDAFLWCMKEDEEVSTAPLEEIPVYYPETLFEESLLCDRKFYVMVFPFIPSPELLMASMSITDKILFIIYPHESALLQNVLRNTDSYFTEFRPSASPGYRFAGTRHVYVRESRVRHEAVAVTSGPSGDAVLDEYEMFLKYLEEQEPESAEDYEHGHHVDRKTYIFETDDGRSIEVRGWENLILYSEGALFLDRKYRWAFPRHVAEGDTVILVSHSVKSKYLREGISRELGEKKEELDRLIKLVAEWKRALRDIREKYTLTEIHRRLREKGLNRNYATIRQWFSSIFENPEKAVVLSVLNPEFNIGPRDDADIKIVGETFGVRTLSENYRYIHAAMKVFRTTNILIGRRVKKEITRRIESGELTGKCKYIRVKKIRSSPSHHSDNF